MLIKEKYPAQGSDGLLSVNSMAFTSHGDHTCDVAITEQLLSSGRPPCSSRDHVAIVWFHLEACKTQQKKINSPLPSWSSALELFLDTEVQPKAPVRELFSSLKRLFVIVFSESTAFFLLLLHCWAPHVLLLYVPFRFLQKRPPVEKNVYLCTVFAF